jgi:two-component system, cell cycle sensor histidine kinase and response regulator CckA
MTERPSYAELLRRNRELEKRTAELERMQQALSLSEERYRLLAENSDDVIWTQNTEFNYTFVSPSITRLLGYSPQEALKNITIENHLTPNSFQIAKQVMTEIIADKDSDLPGKWPKKVQLEKIRKDGSTFWTEAVISRLRNKAGSFCGILGVTRDISDRKRSEEALRESEERYRKLVEHLPDAVLVCEKGKIGFVNPAARKLLHADPAEPVVGKTLTVCGPSGAADRGSGPIETESSPRVAEQQIQRLDESWVPVETVAIPFVDNGRSAMLVLARDISEQKQAETQKRKLEEQVNRVQKLEAIGTLAGGIAHDFNNLMMGIQGNASLLLMDLAPDHPFREPLLNIEKLVGSGTKLTSKLLGYARMGKYELTPLDINQLVRESAETFGRTRKQITIDYDLARDLPSAEGDYGQIEQVLWNLYVNAADAMPAGGRLYLGTAAVDHHQMASQSYTPRAGRYIRLEVTDTGVGMDPSTLQRIFDPFFTTKQMGRGTGLGLASAYGIIKGHGGYIDVESTPGQGASFTIFLPVSGKPFVKKTAQAADIRMGQGLVLLVDDEELILDIGSKMLQKLGYDVLQAAGGQQAVETYRRHCSAIDLVILDMIMPDMGGGDAYDQIRQIDPDVKVLLSSGYSIDGEAANILQRGCDGFIQKPFSLTELSRKVEVVLGRRRSDFTPSAVPQAGRPVPTAAQRTSMGLAE